MTNVEDLKLKLEESISTMSSEEKMSLEAKIYGFTRVPPTIDEFIESDMYIGRGTKNGTILYPYWRQFLRELFPTPLSTTNQIIILTGGIGIGKSTISLIISLYTLCKILLLKDLSYYDIDLGKGVNFIFFHVNTEKASNDFVFPFYNKYFNTSPFFQKNKGNQRHVVLTDSPFAKKAIGGDVIYFNLSEINFVQHHKAVEKVNSAISRFFSRWRSAIGHFGHVVLDSSVYGDASVVEQVIADSPYDIKIVRAPIWEVKGHTGQFSSTFFKVYTGDAVQQPFIIQSMDQVKLLDADKVIDVPDNLINEYKADIYKALQETAGVSTSMTGKYFTDINKLNASFNLEHTIPDVITVDFFDPDDQIWNYVGHLFEDKDAAGNPKEPVIPYDRLLAVRFDVAYASDLAGIAVGYLKDMDCISQDLGLYEPIVDIPVIFGVGRKPGQETALSKLKQFAYDLGKRYDIGLVTTDSFQSKNIQQDLVRDGFKSYYISMDRNNQAYDLAKNAIYEGRLNQAKNQLHMRDMINLRIIGNKVDHLNIYSKDLPDAACGIYKSIVDNLDLFKALSSKYQLEKTRELYDKLYSKPPEIKNIEDMIKKLQR